MILFAIIFIVAVLFLLFKKVVQYNEKAILKINPYIQILIMLVLLLVISFTLILLKVPTDIFGIIIVILSLSTTIYLGVVFQHYYFKLSDRFKEEIKC